MFSRRSTRTIRSFIFFQLLLILNFVFSCLQVIWVCILCRKKQELLSKSGEWINHGMAAAGGDPSRRSEVSSPCMMSDKRPKLERAHSAVEKENVPLLQRSNSLLRRQYSQQEPSSRKDQEHGVSGAHHDEYYRTVRLIVKL